MIVRRDFLKGLTGLAATASLPAYAQATGKNNIGVVGGGILGATIAYTLAEAGARVTLFKENDAYSVGLSDAGGVATLPFRPDQTGTFSVGVATGADLPYLATASVSAPLASPYLFALDQVITDDGSGSSAGNGDGRIDAGETVELSITLRNNGGSTETGLSAVLRSSR